MRSPRTVLAAVLGALVVSGCSAATATLSPPPGVASRNVQVAASFTAGPGPAITYDQRVVKVGAFASVDARSGGGITTVGLEVLGFEPGRRYGAHVHTNPCGATGADAGPHFQNVVDPVQPSVDPRYANPQNEIWLDFLTDQDGTGRVENTVAWQFPADRRPGSIIVHAMPTAVEPGVAGTAGGRAACITVRF
ncbi:superoxide dismutase [Pseudonocardia xinjiangensis]|uniref:superoxide dismutase n=1 Tax=Pseudonocardia xinjiangensis TaxID=75289 RepID=UPI003D89DAE7